MSTIRDDPMRRYALPADLHELKCPALLHGPFRTPADLIAYALRIPFRVLAELVPVYQVAQQHREEIHRFVNSVPVLLSKETAAGPLFGLDCLLCTLAKERLVWERDSMQGLPISYAQAVEAEPESLLHDDTAPRWCRFRAYWALLQSGSETFTASDEVAIQSDNLWRGTSVGAGGFYSPWRLPDASHDAEAYARIVTSESEWALRRDASLVLESYPVENGDEARELLLLMCATVINTVEIAVMRGLWSRAIHMARVWKLAEESDLRSRSWNEYRENTELIMEDSEKWGMQLRGG